MLGALINLSHPQPYLNWSFFSVSIANLVVILTMVVIFGLALLLPFPKDKLPHEPASAEEHEPVPSVDAASSRMLTARVRTAWLRVLPPKKLIPDRQPAYVASWIYVFGVATLAALGLIIVSGVVLMIGGVNWWHQSPWGHFFNSMHLWSVELFMAFMVIHLWGKFWMAAWRGRRALTWMLGVAAFGLSVLEAFTGYLSQQNFDAQWIAANGKDAINATGMGSFFNLMNFGQVLTWHIVLIPLALIVVVAGHIIMVRVRGVSHPIMKARGAQARKVRKIAEAASWRGSTRRYDIIKEGLIATVIVFVLVILLAGLLSSPDQPAISIASWAKIAPADFIATTASELAGTSETANYGPPYNHGTANVQKIGVSWQLLAGVHQPINTAQVFVLAPLQALGLGNPTLQTALKQYNQASAGQQKNWDMAYLSSVNQVSFDHGTPIVPKANDGPVPVLVSYELSYAKSGALDTALLSQQPFYGSDYTKPILFLEDGNYFSSVAKSEHLYGSQWGVMNETGSYPGQPWLWLYALWYQVPGFKTSANVDLIAIYLTGVSTALLLLVPFIPGIRDIPRIIPVYKLVWRRWYKENKRN